METYGKTIKVSEETYQGLAELGTLEDTFDSVIGRLLCETSKVKKQQVKSQSLQQQELLKGGEATAK